MSIEATLLPCPFCGGDRARTIHIRDGRKVACICGACGKPEFHGPLDRPNAETRAIAAWNTRQQAEARATSGAGVPDGWKMVPVEPTPEILIAMGRSADDFFSKPGPYPRSRAVYAAMLAAAPASPTEAPGSEGAGWRYYVDCEFDGHNGALLSIAMVRADGLSIHVETTEVATDPWVIANVVPLMGCNDATTHPLVPLTGVGTQLRDFMRGDPAPVIVADSPVDIGRFCQALMTSGEGGYEPNTWPRLSFEVHDVDCYPTSLAGAVQHNAWWDAMALCARLALNEQGEG